MNKKNYALAALFCFFCTTSQRANAENFQLTTDFSRPASEDAAGGGGCAGPLVVQQIVRSKDSVQRLGRIHAGLPFIQDIFCNVEDRVAISINNRVFAVYAVNSNYEYKNGFISSYKSKDSKVSVRIAHIEKISENFDKDTDCTVQIRKVRLDVEFNGLRKRVYGVVNGGCP